MAVELFSFHTLRCRGPAVVKLCFPSHHNHQLSDSFHKFPTRSHFENSTSSPYNKTECTLEDNAVGGEDRYPFRDVRRLTPLPALIYIGPLLSRGSHHLFHLTHNLSSATRTSLRTTGTNCERLTHIRTAPFCMLSIERNIKLPATTIHHPAH